MRICLVISTLRVGGAERALSALANAWDARGHQVLVLTFESPDARPSFPLAGGIGVRRLDLLRASSGPCRAVTENLTRVRALRRALAGFAPDVAVAFMEQTGVLTSLACRGTGIPVICCERTTPGAYSPGRIWEILRRLVYPAAAAVTFQTARAAAALPWLGGKSVVIPNPVAPAPPPGPAPDLPQPLVMAVGRLAPEKQFDVLLRAFARLAPTHPDWSLALVGEGPERAALEALARDLGVTARVQFTGRVDNVADHLRRAELFALSSRFEGFPNALCEAMACGVPAVAFDCPCGPGEIIRHGVDGLLAPAGDEAAFTAALDRAMGDPGLRAALAARAPEVLERFAEDRILDQWETLLHDTAQGREAGS
ncbi:MAG: glycosyltransferase family 4 protein [Desulfovibrionaceae bacterium]